ncbi:MAG: PD40 domain-containing protein [Candidatus Aminicenantes bacterium]|nr:PD40 domain-containing protein [Candidatus Aminicenantes bacterium]
MSKQPFTASAKPIILSLLLTGLIVPASSALLAQDAAFPKLAGSYLGQTPPGAVAKPFAPGIVKSSHSSVAISPDGTEIYWSDGLLDRAIFVTRLVNGLWTKPVPLSFTRDEGGDGPKLSPDNRKLYFNSDRPRGPGDSRRERIWGAERTAEGWAEPVPLGPEINDEHLHWQVTVDDRGNLYFGSERRGSKGQDDVFLAVPRPGGHEKPVSLDVAVNSKAHEGSPFVAPDGRYLIFLRDSDLWISFRGEGGRWRPAQRLKTPAHACCPYVSPDGKYLFFLKFERDTQTHTVYWMDAAGLGLDREG